MPEKLPPIKIRKVYATDGSGAFTLRAEDLPAAIVRGMTEAELMARQDAEKKAIAAEWRRIRGRN